MTAQAGAHEKVSPGTTCRNVSVKKVVGSSPHAALTE